MQDLQFVIQDLQELLEKFIWTMLDFSCILQPVSLNDYCSCLSQRRLMSILNPSHFNLGGFGVLGFSKALQ